MSKVKALYHIVFCTKARKKTLSMDYLEDLHCFITKIIKDKGARLLRIGGVENHIHILIDLHPSLALSDLVRDMKSLSSLWLKADPRFPYFEGWGTEYYACAVSPAHQDAVVNYIMTQREHHCGIPFDDELIRLHSTAGIAYDDRNMR
ncbi:MAG: IS200/IS605 family transposase [Candidatus Amulumruptor caecigallinarius]|nr:IS200/IS605 family transposase [Candidatus Amulumruptor caecigallinarius]MCM1396446.1 IS200/IS605 family transposase [Candidatus Amulumruptor caecigallinarius]MCM1453497.1 IS200/IS605 family transposase [bacterium]